MRLGQPGIVVLVLAGVLIVVLEVVGAAQVYGSLPLFSYLRGDGAMDVNVANDLQQQSAVGQFGMLVSTLEILTALLLAMLINVYDTGRKVTVIVAIASLVLCFAHLINGKRGGLFMSIFVVVCGIALYCGDLGRAIPKMITMPRSKLAGRLVIASIVGLALFLFGFLAVIRNQNRTQMDTFEQISLYLQYPLANMEFQCSSAGLGPHEFYLWLPFRDILPYKWSKGTETLDLNRPPRVEPTSPAGLYELIQWSYGIWGVIIFSFLLGCFVRYFYTKSFDNPYFLFSYCQLAFALFMSHSFNQFLILAYIPFPLFIYLLGYAFRAVPFQMRRVLVRTRSGQVVSADPRNAYFFRNSPSL